MSEKPLDQTNQPEPQETEIVVNEYGATHDPAVVVDEPDRTVLLTDNETIVIEKEPRIDIVPVNRPRKVYTGMWGQAELITAGLAMLAVFTVVLIYIFLVIPANRELERNRVERNRLEAELMSARTKYGSITDAKTHVSELIASADDFEARYLPVASSGRAALYQRINSLIASNGLVNTSGPDYAPLEMAETGVENEEDRGRGKHKSIFPGIYVTMTLDGTYHNLRRFIREIETGGDFVVVSAVELEPSDAESDPDKAANPNPQVAGPNSMTPMGPNSPNMARPPGFNNFSNPAMTAPSQVARQKGKMHGEIVSLRLEMAAYFRRAMAPVATEAPAAP
jgi:hypothetical protein